MKPELLVSKAKARKGLLSTEEVLELANYAASMRDMGVVLVRAYLAAEDFTQRGGSREAAAEALERADNAIEAWAESVFGENWREIGTRG